MKSIGKSAFSYCIKLTSVTLPNSVTTIGDYVFWYCKELTSITISNSVATIGNYAFGNCFQIKQIYCEGTTPPKIYSDTFTDIYSTCKLNVPKGCSTVYGTSPYWRNITNFIEL